MQKLKNIKILYIDDEENIRNEAVEYLNFYCDNVYEAHNGKKGLEVYEKVNPDIIITDIKMPELNGLDMVKEIRKNDKETKIIIATAFLDSSYLLKAVELSLVKYLIKPITEASLLPVLKTCLLSLNKISNIYTINKIFIFDIFNKTLFKNKIQVNLTRKEIDLLYLLISNKKRVVTYEEINNYVWKSLMSDNALRSVIKDLRNRISKDCIKNISGMGYQIKLIENCNV